MLVLLIFANHPQFDSFCSPLASGNSAIESFPYSVEDVIDEDYLRGISGQVDLSQVPSITLQVNTNHQSILGLGDILVNLKTLVLDRSVISSVRDLGGCLRHLEALSLNDCGLTELDGVGILTNLKCLSVQDNMLTDVAPLAMHDNIRVIPVSLFGLHLMWLGAQLARQSFIRHIDMRHALLLRPAYEFVPLAEPRRACSALSSCDRCTGAAVAFLGWREGDSRCKEQSIEWHDSGGRFCHATGVRGNGR